MTTIYDPEEVERLIAEAREDDARLGEWSHDRKSVRISLRGIEAEANIERDYLWLADYRDADAIARTRNNLRPMADQLEAAHKRITDLQRDLDNSSKIARDEVARLNQILAQNNKDWIGIRSELEAARADIARLRSELDTATAARVLAEARSNVLDASHAARDATKLRISAWLGLPASATQDEIAAAVDAVVDERDRLQGHVPLAALQREAAEVNNLNGVVAFCAGVFARIARCASLDEAKTCAEMGAQSLEERRVDLWKPGPHDDPAEWSPSR